MIITLIWNMISNVVVKITFYVCCFTLLTFLLIVLPIMGGCDQYGSKDACTIDKSSWEGDNWIKMMHETSLIWVNSLGVKLWLVYFRSLHICKNYHINDKYMINEIISQSILDLGLKPSRRYGSFKFISRPIWKR
jgi:hypothetical protein